MVDAYYGGDLKNPFQFMAEKHLVVSLHGDELWLIADTPLFSEKELQKLYEMGFVDAQGWGSVFYPTRKLGTAVRVLKRAVEELKIDVVVFNRMNRVLYDKLCRMLGAVDKTPKKEEEDMWVL